MHEISCLSKDFLAAHLRSQLDTLKDVLSNIENSEKMDVKDNYVIESLQRAEINLRSLRKFLNN